MDHLLLPEGAEHWISVPYDAPITRFYEKVGQGFFEYPSRVGWLSADVWGEWLPKGSKDDLDEEEDLRSDRTPQDAEQFFQTWLFFGLIIEVLRLGGIEVTTNDFLAPPTNRKQMSHIVTTCQFPSFIVQWREKSQHRKDAKLLESIIKICDLTGRVLDHYCAGGRPRRSPEQYERLRWTVRDEVTTSIVAVATTLRRTAYQLYGTADNLPKWPVTNSRLLQARIARKWCGSEAAMIMEDFDIDGQYFIAAAESHPLEYLDKHYKCTSEACHAKVEDGTYVTKHAEGCPGDDYDPEIPFLGYVGEGYGEVPKTFVEGVRSVMTCHHLPFTIWKPDECGVTVGGYAKHVYLGPEAGFRTPPYVAISHVWADGMGNPFNNALPICQMNRIQKMVDELCDNHLSLKNFTERAGFWMDTLCCLVAEEDKELRKQSIAEMREIYSEAVAVLIIDPWITSIPSSAPIPEICHRIYTSGWSRRLWTHQEGYLGREVFYQFQDKPMSLQTISTKVTQFQMVSTAEGRPVSFPNEAQGKTGTYYKLVKPFVDGIRAGHLDESARSSIYKPLATSLGYRSTSKIEDELLCVASVMGLDVGPYLDIKEKAPEETAEHRMVHFLEEIRRFKQGIIFNSYRRLKTPGYRWAPASMLGHRYSGLGDIDTSTDATITDYSSLALEDKHIEMPSLGMTVNMTRLTSQGLSLYPGSKYVLLALRGRQIALPACGLPVDYPGYTIKFRGDRHGLTIDMAERRFGVQTPSASSSLLPFVTPPALFKTSTAPKSPPPEKPPTPAKTPSFGNKIPSVGKFPQLGKVKSPKLEADAEPEPKVKAPEPVQIDLEKLPGTSTNQYVVYVAENNVRWQLDTTYALILQKPLNSGAHEFMAMIGLCSAGPGSRTWVQSLCSAVVRSVKHGDSRKLTAGLDFVEVSDVKNTWVVT